MAENDMMTNLVNQEINKAFAAWAKRDLPNMIKENMAEALQSYGPQLSEQFMNSLAEQLPSDEEIDAMEAEGYDPYGQPYDPRGYAPPPYGYPPEGYEEGYEEGVDPLDPEVFFTPEELNELEEYLADNPELNAQLIDLARANEEKDALIQQLSQEREQAQMQAEVSDRQAQIQAALNKFPFASDRAREVAFHYFADRVERLDDGRLVAATPNGDLPLDKFIEEQMGELGGLLSAKAVGGAGANGGGMLRTPVPTMDQIKPGMSKDEQAAVMKHAVSQLAVNQGQ